MLEKVSLPSRPIGHYLNHRDVRSQDIFTNHFRMTLPALSNLYIFSIKFYPIIEDKNGALKNKILNDALPQIQSFISKLLIT